MTETLFVTHRLTVRPKRRCDAEPLHDAYGDAEVMRYVGGAFPTLARTRDFVDAHIRHQALHGFSMWSVVERRSSAIVGDVGFLAYDGGVEIGWHLRRSTWGRGYGTEAARACVAYGFDELGFERISAFVELANAASLRVVAKLGMEPVREGAGGARPWAEFALRAASTAPA